MSTSTQVVELFNIFSETFGKEKAQIAIKDIEEIIDSRRQDLATKSDIKEIELKIEQVRSSLIKWIVGVTLAQISITVTLIVAFVK